MTSTCLVDTANSEPKGSALDTGAVHVVTNQEDKLRMFDEQFKKEKRLRKTYTEELLEMLGVK